MRKWKEVKMNMQAVKGLVTEGRFTPTNNMPLPRHAHAILIIEETPPQITEVKTEERQARQAWLARLRQARQQAEGEPLPPFLPRTPMEQPHGIAD